MEDGQPGGTQQFVIGLAAGLSAIAHEGNEHYSFLTIRGSDKWLRPYLAPGMERIETAPPNPRRPSVPGERWIRPVARLVRDAIGLARGARGVSVARSDGSIEAARIDVMHFPTQLGFLTAVPSIYHPWDLQHVHLPALFTAHTRLEREVRYRAFCEQARLVSVASSWVRDDLIQHYGLPPEKIAVVPIAPVTAAYEDPDAETIAATRQRLGLPDRFLFYPAQTFRHKNHLALLDALQKLRGRGEVVNVVCSGSRTDHYPAVERRIRELGLGEQLRFVGYVSPKELQCLYALSTGVIFPSLFEGGGLPILEAFAARRATACSNVTCLPALAADGALLFDPRDVDDIARAVSTLWGHAGVREQLVRNAERRLAGFSWETTARTFRAHYRRIAGVALSEADRALLAAPVIT